MGQSKCADAPSGQCHSNKENLLRSLTAMKWADKIFPGFGLVWKEKRHILVLLDEKAGTGSFDDARITPQATLGWQQAIALTQVLQHPRLPLLLGGPLQRQAEGESGSQDADGLRKTESIHVDLWGLLGRAHHPGAQGIVAQEQGPSFLHDPHGGLAQQDRSAQLMLLHLIIDQFELEAAHDSTQRPPWPGPRLDQAR